MPIRGCKVIRFDLKKTVYCFSFKKREKKEEKKRRILHQPAKFPELSADQERFHSRESYQASPSL